MFKKIFFLLLCLHLWAKESHCQHVPQPPPFSLQTAVDELHRREAQQMQQLALNAPPSRYNMIPRDADYFDEDLNGRNDNKMDRLISDYLARDEPIGGLYGDELIADEEEDGTYFLPEEKKRSFFRERDEKNDAPFASVFRERDIEPITQSELAEEFLREIEEAREMEREEKYKDALRQLWEKYQQQENEVEGQIYDDEKRNPDQINYYGPLMQRKRTYPVLPWLPVSDRKKRFPVAKRSPKQEDGKPNKNDKISKDLEEIFGEPEEKKKRSTDTQTVSTEKSDIQENSSHVHTPDTDGAHQHGGHHKHEHKKRIEDPRESKESDEHEDEDSEEHGDDHEEEDEEEGHYEFDDEEDDEERKKKRDIKSSMKKKRSNLEFIREDGKHSVKQADKQAEINKNRQKKSVDWSKYFGLDKKKKSAVDDSEYLTPEKLAKMDKKLQSIEDVILSDTVKYTGAHTGVSSPSEIRRIKDHVVSSLATAYSLEKMRHALNSLRQSIANENHLQRNEVQDGNEFESASDKAKRLSVKKEKVEFDKLHHTINAEADHTAKEEEHHSNSLNENEDDKKKKMKRNRYQKYPIIPNDIVGYPEELESPHFEPLNDAYLGSKLPNYRTNEFNQCPIIESMSEKCRNLGILSGDVQMELLPLCNVHQMCHFCSNTQTGCDFEYLTEADRVCGRNGNCLAAARASLRLLRQSPGPQIGIKECLKIPCLYRLLKEIRKR